MSLTVGSGPFGPAPGGAFNVEAPGPEGVLYFEESPRWVRGDFAGETVVDSRRARLLHEHGRLPVYYFPREDVRMDLLEPSATRAASPTRGEVAYWSLRVGDRVSEDAAWTHPRPPAGAPPLDRYVAFDWPRLDRWREEDEEVFVHPRDPYHRVDVLPTSRHVVVTVGGEVVADTRRARVLYETGLPPRWYVPREDVREAALEPAPELATRCPYKGVAAYFHVRTAAGREEGLAWQYPEPIPAVADLVGHVCFFNERADLDVDGERQSCPATQWSGTDWIAGARR